MYYFFRIKDYNTDTIQRLHKCIEDGIVYNSSHIEYEEEIGNFIIVAKTKKDAKDIFCKYIFEVDNNYEEYSKVSKESEMEEYYKNANLEDLPYGGYPYYIK